MALDLLSVTLKGRVWKAVEKSMIGSHKQDRKMFGLRKEDFNKTLTAKKSLKCVGVLRSLIDIRQLGNKGAG